MSNGIKVTKRDGRIDPDLEKMHLMVGEATKGLAGVFESVEMKSGIQFYDLINMLRNPRDSYQGSIRLDRLGAPQLSVRCSTTSPLCSSKRLYER